MPGQISSSVMQPFGVVVGARVELVASLARAVSDGGMILHECVHKPAELLRALQHLRADLVLLDANLGSPHGGVELVASGAIGEDTATVLVSDEVDEELLERTRRVGADGFLGWPASRLQVEATICAALGARRFRPPPADGQVQATAVLHRIARELAGVQHLLPVVPMSPALRPLPELDSLSPREWEVLRGLVSHQRVPTLAREMHISPHTVRNHLKAIFAKLSVHSQAELLEKVVDRNASRLLSLEADEA